MFALCGTIALLIVAFFVQKSYPFLAGIIAVTPVKIIGASLMVFETSGLVGLTKTIEGMIIGQFVIGFLLLGIYVMVRP